MSNLEDSAFDLIEQYFSLRERRYVVEITGDAVEALKLMEKSEEDFSPGVVKNVYHVNGLITKKLDKAGIAYRVLRRPR